MSASQHPLPARAAAPDALLALDRVTARDRGRTVLSGISLSLPRGQTLALLGPPGSGKTATLLLVAGFLRPTLGTVRLAGRDITVMPPEQRGIAMAFRDDALFPHLSVLDNVGFGLKMRGVERAQRRRQAREMLAALGIEALAERHPARLDAAQRRLVALARAAAARPALLLLDEPAGASDPAPHDPAWHESVRAARAAAPPDAPSTVVLATHDRALAFGLADIVVLLRAGQVEQSGTPRALYEQPASRFVASFTGGCNLLPATLLGHTGGAAVVALADGTAGARCPSGMAPGPVLLCLRPHRARLDPAGPLRGIVVALAYHGAQTRVMLQCGDASVVAELAQAPAGLAAGAERGVTWDPADAWLLPVAP